VGAFFLLRHARDPDFLSDAALALFGWQSEPHPMAPIRSLVYITPVLGGYLADRYLGSVKAVLFGGLLLAAGHT
jgi:hypothetical protein